MFETLYQIHRENLLAPISLHLLNLQGSPCYGSLKWLPGRYDNKVNSVGQLDAKKLAALVLVYDFILGFPASLLYVYLYYDKLF